MTILCKWWRIEVRLRRTCLPFLGTKLRPSARVLHGVILQSRIFEPYASSKPLLLSLTHGFADGPVFWGNS